MKRRILAIVLALVTWLVLATVLDVLLRKTWPAYATVERALLLSLGMQWARLAIAAIASLGAGFVAARAAPSDRLPALVSGILLLALFVPEHIQLGARLPLWYHLTFLLTLVPLVLAGNRLGQGRPTGPGAAG